MTRPLFCFCAAFALGCIASQYFLVPALWLPAAGIVLVLARLPSERAAKGAAAALCGVSLILFVWYYPALAGVPVPRLWWQSLEILPSYGFY